MLAHSSPTLIAACHVLHRLYMPRHPRIALTSRLRVHTTNDNTGSTPARVATRNSAEQCHAVCIGVVENRSAFVVMNASPLSPATSLAARRAPFRTNASRHRFEKTIHNVKYRKRRLNAVPPRVNHGDTCSLHHPRSLSSACPLAPVSHSKAAPYGAPIKVIL